MKHIEFDDAIKLSKLYPNSFQIPSREDLLKLEIVLDSIIFRLYGFLTS